MWSSGGGDVDIAEEWKGWEEVARERVPGVVPNRGWPMMKVVVVVVVAAAAVVVGNTLLGVASGFCVGALVGVVEVVVAAKLGSWRRLGAKKRRDGGSVGVSTSS